MKYNIKKSQVFILLAFFLLIKLSDPHFIRYSNNQGSLIGDSAYYHSRIAEEIVRDGIPAEDSFAFGGREYIMQPYHIALAGFAYFFGVEAGSKIIPLLSGIVSLAFFYFILKKIGFGLLERISSSAILAMSPIFIYTFIVSSPISLMLFLDLFGFYFYMKKGKANIAVSTAALFIASIFSFSNLLFVLAVLSAYSLTKEKNRNRLSIITFFMVISLLFKYIPFFFKHGFPAKHVFEELSLIQMFVSDMGGVLGFSIFTILLACLGLAAVWKRKKEFYIPYLLLVFIVAYSFFFNYAAVYSNFVISILAGIAFARFAVKKWELRQIRNISLLLLFCGVLFSAVSFSVRVGNMPPEPELVEALEWLKDNSREGDVVFSHYTKGFWIEGIAGRRVMMDGLLEYSPNVEKYYNESLIIFETFDIRETRSFLLEHDSRFVLITNDMDQGLVWDKPGQGLAFLLKNNETFKKIYSKQGTEIYEYVYGGKS